MLHNLGAFLVSAAQITLLDIVLSGDNVGVIAMAIRNLNPRDARRASIVGVSGALALRIVFASIITRIMMISWLPIKLIGGLLLLKVTLDLLKDDATEEASGVKSYAGFWRAVSSIIVADASMSLDNVLAIGGLAGGNIGLIALGVSVNAPILFFGSQFVASLMQKYRITIYIGGAVLAHTALLLVLEDGLVAHHVSHHFAVVFPWAVAAATLGYGFLKSRATASPHQLNG